MENAVEAIVGHLTKKAAKHLFEAISDRQHDLDNCSAEVKDLLLKGGKQIEDERFEDAVRSFENAARIDPKNVSARIRLLRVYKNQGKNLTALVVGGGALNLAVAPKARSQIFCFLGDICVDIFKSSKSLIHIDEGISFYNSAIDSSAANIHPLWNRAQAYLLYQQHANDVDVKRDAGQRARSSIDSVIRMGEGGLGNSHLYWKDVMLDLEKGNWWPSGEYWQEKKEKLNDISEKFQMMKSDEGSDEEIKEYSRGNRKMQKLKAGLIAASMILSLLGWAAFPSEATGMQAPSSVAIESTTHTYAIFPESQAGVEHDWKGLVRIEPHWDDLAAIEPKWEDLA